MPSLPQLPDNQTAAQYAQQSLDTAHQQLERLRPLHPAVNHFWQQVLGGQMDPETAAVHARLGMMGHPAFQPPAPPVSLSGTPGPIEPARTAFRNSVGFTPTGNPSDTAEPYPTGERVNPMGGPGPTAQPQSLAGEEMPPLTQGDLPALQSTVGPMSVGRRTTREEREEKQTRDIEARAGRQERGIEGKTALQEQKDTAAGERASARNQSLADRTSALVDSRLKTSRASIALNREKLQELQSRAAAGRLDKSDAEISRALASEIKVERDNIASMRAQHAQMLRAFTPPNAAQLKSLSEAEKELQEHEDQYGQFITQVRKQFPSRTQVPPAKATP